MGNTVDYRKRAIIVLVLLLVLSIAFLAGASASGWWASKEGVIRDGETSYNWKVIYYLDHYEWLYSNLGTEELGASHTTNYSDLGDWLLEQETFGSRMIVLMMELNAIWYLSMLCLLAAAALTILTIHRKWSIYPAVMLNMLVGLMIISMGIYFYIKFPSDPTIEFWGSNERVIYEDIIGLTSWSPGFGWACCFISGTLLVSTSVLMARFHSQFGSISPGEFLTKRAKPIVFSTAAVVLAVLLVFSYYNYMDLDGDGYVTKDDLFPNDPLEWEDLDRDGIGDNYDDFFAGYPAELEMFYKYLVRGRVTGDIDYRLFPRGGAGSDGDRIYIPAGRENSQNFPIGLYARDSDSNLIWGGAAYETGSEISTGTHYVNFGRDDAVTEAEPYLFFGTTSGMLHMLRDGFDSDSRNYTPSGDDVWKYQLDGAITGDIVIDNYQDSQFNEKDMFAACTDNGTVYVFSGPVHTFNSTANITDIGKPTLRWKKNLGSPLIGATVISNEDELFVATGDGELHGLDMESGLEIQSWNGNVYSTMGHEINSIPRAFNRPGAIYFTSENSQIHAVWASNGTCVAGWDHMEGDDTVPGLELYNTHTESAETGKLTELEFTPDGSTMIVGTDTGFVYSIATTTSGHNNNFCFNATFNGLETQCVAKPYYDSKYSRFLFVPAICLNGTPEDTLDDFSVVYCLASNQNDTLIWRLTLPGRIEISPVSFINNDHVGSSGDLILICHEGENSTLYCYNCVTTRPD